MARLVIVLQLLTGVAIFGIRPDHVNGNIDEDEVISGSACNIGTVSALVDEVEEYKDDADALFDTAKEKTDPAEKLKNMQEALDNLKKGGFKARDTVNALREDGEKTLSEMKRGELAPLLDGKIGLGDLKAALKPALARKILRKVVSYTECLFELVEAAEVLPEQIKLVREYVASKKQEFGPLVNKVVGVADTTNVGRARGIIENVKKIRGNVLKTYEDLDPLMRKFENVVKTKGWTRNMKIVKFLASNGLTIKNLIKDVKVRFYDVKESAEEVEQDVKAIQAALKD